LNLLIKHAGMGQQKHGLLFCPAISWFSLTHVVECHCWLSFHILSCHLALLKTFAQQAGMGQQKQGLLFCPAISWFSTTTWWGWSRSSLSSVDCVNEVHYSKHRRIRTLNNNLFLVPG
jgi:hypothetical protein